jgi:hypothetical protein
MSDNRQPSTHCSWTFLISEGQLIMKALGVGRSQRKTHGWPSTPATTSVFAKCFACWGTATERANRSLGWRGGKAGGEGEEQRIFFVCACPCIILFSLWTHPYTKHKDNFFFFFKKRKATG